ncbi:MAG: peptide chain release factor N(5)-glutamine methyltransferase [Alkalilacustris sp.]
MAGDTVTSALALAAARLRAAGVEDPAGDSRRLVAHALGLPAGRLVTMGREALPPAVWRRLEDLLVARAARQPMAQILGRRAFWAHEFEVTPDVLDPRPETEVLVAAALERPFRRVLDLGTGSGCILLSLLAECPDATGLGVDLSAAALAVARRNAARLGLADRVAWSEGNWLDGVTGTYDLVVSNPPYIASAELPDLAPEVRLWEPPMALCPSGDPGDGLAAYRRIAAAVGRVLAPGGRVVLEVGAGQAAAVAQMLRAAGLGAPDLRHDLDGRARVVMAAAP